MHEAHHDQTDESREACSGGEGQPEHAAKLRAEVEAVCASALFRKAPTRARILKYLCEETIAGRGATLKSYSIAVAGLGRAANFDAQSDSYPRVQITRLRRLLGDYYSGPGADREARLEIPPGSYELRLTPKLLAAPDPLPAPQVDQDAPAPLELRSVPEDVSHYQRRSSPPLARRHLAWAGVVAVVLGLALLAPLAYRAMTYERPPQSAKLFIAPTVSDQDPRSLAFANDANNQLLAKLSQSWVYRIMASTPGPSTASDGHSYRLETEIGPAADGQRVLYARLIDQDLSTLLWSKEVILPDDTSLFDDAIDNLAAALGGSFGVIASNETQRLRDVFAPGYACLLQYNRFLATRNRELQGKVISCLRQPADEMRLEGIRRASNAMSILDVPPSAAQQDKLLQAALFEAQRAAVAFPDDPYPHFALARLAAAQFDCGTAAIHSRLAIENAGDDPKVVGTLAVLATLCGAPEAGYLSDRAFRFIGDDSPTSRLNLTLLALVTHRPEHLAVLATLPAPRRVENPALIYLCNALTYAALDRIDAARSNWSRFRGEPGGSHLSDDDAVRQFLISNLSRKAVIGFLREKRVIS